MKSAVMKRTVVLILNILMCPYSLAPDTWEYSNCHRSHGIIACRLSVVLTKPPFRYGSIFNPATVMAINPRPNLDCFGYRSRSAVRSLICNGKSQKKRSWRHTSDSLLIAVSYLSTVYKIFKEQWFGDVSRSPLLLPIR